MGCDLAGTNSLQQAAPILFCNRFNKMNSHVFLEHYNCFMGEQVLDQGCFFFFQIPFSEQIYMNRSLKRT